MVRILVGIVAGALPCQKLFVHWVLLLFLPSGELLVRQGGTHVLLDQNFKQFYFAQAAPEVVPSQGACIGSVLHGGFFVVLFACDAFLKYVHAFIE